MPAVTKPKPPKRQTTRRPVTRKPSLPAGMAIDPVSGLAVVLAQPGQKVVTTAQIKAIMADFP